MSAIKYATSYVKLANICKFIILLYIFSLLQQLHSSRRDGRESELSSEIVAPRDDIGAKWGRALLLVLELIVLTKRAKPPPPIYANGELTRHHVARSVYFISTWKYTDTSVFISAITRLTHEIGLAPNTCILQRMNISLLYALSAKLITSLAFPSYAFTNERESACLTFDSIYTRDIGVLPILWQDVSAATFSIKWIIKFERGMARLRHAREHAYIQL